MPMTRWYRFAAWAAVVGWAAVIFALSSRSTIPQPFGLSSLISSVLGHLGAYAILGALLAIALRSSGCPPARASWLAVLLATLYGISDEWHQSFVPGRHPSLGDVLTDTIGATLGVAVLNWFQRLWVRTSYRFSSNHNDRA